MRSRRAKWPPSLPACELNVSLVRQAVYSNADICYLNLARGDAFHSAALKAHIAEFDFADDPIDIALRKLLLGLHLPRETQQIDRVMEAFAEQYNACNPALFSTPDQPYILAFSMIMLHTDAFNRSNKNKMTKADYVKNTRIDGILPEVLEVIYDNITYAPFVYAEDEEGITGEVGVPLPNSAGMSPTASKEKGKVDVYGAIAMRQTKRFRVDASLLVPVKSGFNSPSMPRSSY